MSKESRTNGKDADAKADPGARTIFGIDSHARTTTVCALVVETGETQARMFRGNDYAAMAGWREPHRKTASSTSVNADVRRPCRG